MGLLYADEHVSCMHYQRKSPLIQVHSYKKGDIWEQVTPSLSALFFVKEGSMNVSLNHVINEKVHKQEIIFIPPNSISEISFLEDSYVLIIYFRFQVNLCECFSMTQLYPYKKEDSGKDGLCILKFNRQIADYINLLDLYMQDGINCIRLYEMKKQEIFLLLRAYYEKELLASFFAPILDKEDMQFKNFVLQKCLHAKNVQDLAYMANYSTSGFIKKFTRCFDESPYRWISKFKADRILHELKTNVKSFKEIATEYNFSSMPHFVDFCKKQFGTTPTEIRKNTVNTPLKR